MGWSNQGLNCQVMLVGTGKFIVPLANQQARWSQHRSFPHLKCKSAPYKMNESKRKIEFKSHPKEWTKDRGEERVTKLEPNMHTKQETQTKHLVFSSWARIEITNIQNE